MTRPRSSGSSRSSTRCCGAYHQKFLEDAERSGAPVAVVDVPLLFETGGENRVDAVVVVTTTPEIQRERILARDNMTGEKLDAILARQTARTPKSAGAPISWWIPRMASIRCGRESATSWTRLLGCRGGDPDSS